MNSAQFDSQEHPSRESIAAIMSKVASDHIFYHDEYGSS